MAYSGIARSFHPQVVRWKPLLNRSHQSVDQEMTDWQVECLDIGSNALRADVWRVARIITERYLAAGAAPSWDVLLEIEEETLCDISLLGRWPPESLVGFFTPAELDPGETSNTGASTASNALLSFYIRSLFSRPVNQRDPTEPPCERL